MSIFFHEPYQNGVKKSPQIKTLEYLMRISIEEASLLTFGGAEQKAESERHF